MIQRRQEAAEVAAEEINAHLRYSSPRIKIFTPHLCIGAGFTRLRRDTAGQSMAEFALLFPVILLLIMGIMEFSLLANAHAVVNYAAFVAARSAIVNHADPEKMQRAAAIACIPISPRASAVSGVSGLLNLDFSFLNASFSGYSGVSDILERAAFAYFTTKVESSPQNGAYEVTVYYLYPLKFPVISKLAAFVSEPGSPLEIFSSGPLTPPSDMRAKAATLTALNPGSKFIVISKQCKMGN